MEPPEQGACAPCVQTRKAEAYRADPERVEGEHEAEPGEEPLDILESRRANKISL
jgi:hypothetical protein